MQANETALRRRLAWGCRRGMLELDLLLSKLAEQLATMNPKQLADANELLSLGDQQLWDLLVARSTEPKASYASLVTQLRN